MVVCLKFHLLSDHPEINVNWADPEYGQFTALHATSFHGHAEIVKLLLAHPNIKVNLKDIYGQTPFSLGSSPEVFVVQELLKDPRVNTTLDDDCGRTPLWWASHDGNHEVIEWLIASGRDLGDVMNKKVKISEDGEDYTALEASREENKTDVVSLLERFLVNPAQTRHELRVKLGLLDEMAAEVFALTVFLCDDLLHPKPASHVAATPDPTAAATRFFAIAKRLSMELQMILCHHAVGSTKQNILRKDSEAAFKSLASKLLSP